jgi:hypothetical protein
VARAELSSEAGAEFIAERSEPPALTGSEYLLSRPRDHDAPMEIAGLMLSASSNAEIAVFRCRPGTSRKLVRAINGPVLSRIDLIDFQTGPGRVD